MIINYKSEHLIKISQYLKIHKVQVTMNIKKLKISEIVGKVTIIII